MKKNAGSLTSWAVVVFLWEVDGGRGAYGAVSALAASAENSATNKEINVLNDFIVNDFIVFYCGRPKEKTTIIGFAWSYCLRLVS